MNITTKNLQVGADLKLTTRPEVMHDQGPPGLEHFNDECCGPSGIACAVEELLEGTSNVVRFVRAHRHNKSWMLIDQFFVGVSNENDDPQQINSRRCVRWADEDGNPEGYGSHSVVSSNSQYCDSVAHVAAEIAAVVTGEPAFFGAQIPIRLVQTFWVAMDSKIDRRADTKQLANGAINT